MATIAQNLQTIQNIKENIKTAIENKGVTVGDSSFTDYPTLINDIPQENTGGDITLTNIDITTNGTYTAPDGEGYKTINVDVPTGGGTPTKVDVAAAEMRFGYSPFSEISDIFDFSNVGNFNHMFSYCYQLQSVPDTLENCKPYNVEYMFNECYNLRQSPKIDLGNISSIRYMYNQCQSLQSLPDYSFGYIEDMTNAFSSCVLLTEIPNLDTTYKVMNMSECFMACHSLTDLPIIDCSSVKDGSSPFGWQNLDNLTYLWGFKDLKHNFYGGDFLNVLPNLSEQSLINVIHHLWDWTNYPNGIVHNDFYNQDFDYGTDHTLRFGQENLDKLSDGQIADATSKGWTLIA